MSQPLCGYEGILFLCYLGIFVGVGVFVFGFRPGGLALLGCRFAATATTATFFGGFAVVFGLLVVGDFECRGFDDGSGQQCRCCRGLGVGGAFVCFFLFGSCRKCRGDFGFRLRPRFRLGGRGRLLPTYFGSLIGYPLIFSPRSQPSPQAPLPLPSWPGP